MDIKINRLRNWAGITGITMEGRRWLKVNIKPLGNSQHTIQTEFLDEVIAEMKKDGLIVED